MFGFKGIVWADEEKVYVRANYSRSFVNACRDIEGRRWDPFEKINVFPRSSLSDVIDMADRFNVFVPAVLREGTNVEMLVFTNSTRIFNVEMRGNKVTIRFDYNLTLIKLIRSYIPKVSWNSSESQWECGLEELTEALKFAEDFDLTVSPDMDDVINSVTEARREMIEASSATTGEIEIPGIAQDLLPYQKAGVLYMQRVRKGFLADQPGLGKTVQALAVVASENAYPLVVVCPNTLKLNWEREVEKFFPHLKVSVLNGTKKSEIEKSDVIVVNYDILHGRGDDIVAHGFKSLVVDESHAIKNGVKGYACPVCDALVRGNSKKCSACMSTGIKPVEKWSVKRTGAVMRLAKMLQPEDFVILLTGTPITNRPNELIPQLEAIGRLANFGGSYKFKNRYCPQKNVAINTVELNNKLRETCFIRRLKTDVYGELPPLRNAVQHLSPASDEMKWYRQIEADAIEYFAERARQIAKEEGSDGSAAYWEERLRLEPIENLIRITALREAIAKVKYNSIVEWLDNFIESSDNEKVIVFAEHIEIVERLSKKYGNMAVKIRGGVSVKKRQEAVDRFQNDPTCRIFIGNMKAASEGLTLTAASDVVFCELGWTPAVHDQCVSRCYGRINDMHGATAWYLLVPATVDTHVYGLLEEKRSVVDSVTDGVEMKEGTSIVGDLAVHLARKGLEK